MPTIGGTASMSDTTVSSSGKAHMQIDPERIARWRGRADEYRVCAEACISAGAQRAYRALAECADSMADRMECGTLKVKALDASAPNLVDAAADHQGGNEPVN